jgi:hypothetical protein
MTSDILVDPPLPVSFGDTQARIKGLVGPRHLVTFAEQKKIFRLYSRLYTYMLHFVGPIFSRRP